MKRVYQVLVSNLMTAPDDETSFSHKYSNGTFVQDGVDEITGSVNRDRRK